MTGPLTWVGTYTIKPGKAEECRERLSELADLVEANEPRLIAFNAYVDEPATRVSIVQVHPDAESMAFHLEVVADHLSSAFDYLGETVSSEMYGPAPDGLVESERAWVEPDRLRIQPLHVAGFTRTNAR